MGDFVSTELDGSVAVVTIENPPMNALSAPLLEELEAEIDRLDADDDVRAIVLVGAGERAFVAGADIKEFPSLREAAAEANERGSARGHPEARAPHGRGAHAVRRGDPRLLPRWRSRARHVLRPPGGFRRRPARAARDQARAHPRRRRHAAVAAARRDRARAVPEHDRRVHRCRDRIRLAARREGRAARGAARDGARDRADDRDRARPSPSGFSASSHARRATFRSRKGFAARPTASVAVSNRRTAPRASRRSSRSASRVHGSVRTVAHPVGARYISPLRTQT